jgi:hypothetical protein
MADIVEKHFLSQCGTEIPARELEFSTDFENETWFTDHLDGCLKCKDDTKEALRQTIASMKGLLLTQQHTIASYQQGMNDRRYLLTTVKTLLVDATAQTAEWGRTRAAWIEKCNQTLDMSRP